MSVWEFDVGVTTRELLRRGVTVDWWTRVTVSAESHLEASQIAIQMAWCSDIDRQDFYATECLPRV